MTNVHPLLDHEPRPRWPSSARGAPPQTLGSVGRTRIQALCAAIGRPDEAGRACAIFDLMGATWRGRRVDLGPAWPSDITDDHTPFEFSLAFEDDRPELRMLTEPQGDAPSLPANWEAGWELNERLRGAFGVSIDRALAVKDLFEPRHAGNRFALWHATDLRRGRDPRFKLYLSPWSRGPEEARGVVGEALARLGLSDSWDFVRERVLRRGDADTLGYFALDLGEDTAARVKLYVLHERVRAEEVEPVVAAARALPSSGDARWFCRAVTGHEGPFGARPLISCLAFVAGRGARPITHTLHVPVRCYAAHDASVLDRVVGLMSSAQAWAYRAAVNALANRPLDRRTGIQTYVSFRHENDRRRLTIYLAPEAYQT
jgi:DMATS type aromatic prenyltransferase